jgi:polysaccharide biosynthesis protein PslH
MSANRLLFLSHRLPYPPHNGAAIRTYNILRQLARHYAITALCFDREDPATRSIPLETRVAALSQFGQFEVFPIPQDRSLPRLAWDHVRSMLSGRAYTYFLHDSSAFEASLRRHLAQTRFDLVHLDSLDLVRWAPLVAHLPAIVTHHNLESALLRRRAEAERSLARRWYMRFQAGLVEREERNASRAFALNITVSDTDADGLRKLVPGLKTAVIPNGVDVDAFQPAGSGQEGCVFVGGTTWFPNKDGLEWFAAEILPELNRRDWKSEVVWVGRATDGERARYNAMPGIRLTGYVDDIRPYVHRAACFIVPLRVGGGTRLKVLDAWAMGKAVVSTRLGSEGLDARHGENVLFAETPAEFAEAMLRVLGDEALRNRLGQAARETAVRLYSWDGLGRKMAALYAAVESERAEAPRSVGDQVVAEGSAG